MKSFYVYYSYEEWGRGYIGKRECDCLPEEDDGYFGSFKDKSFMPTQKVILSAFSSKEEALEAEVTLHEYYQVDINPHFANKARQKSEKFHYSFAGQYWVTDGTEELRIYDDEKIPDGFRKGRLLEFRRWWTDGITDLFLLDGDKIPEGFEIGRSRMSGERNTQHGVRYRWVNNGSVNKKLWNGLPLPKGWKEGLHMSEEGSGVRKQAVAKLLSKKLPDGRSEHSVKAGLANKLKSQKQTELTRICDGKVFLFDSLSDAARAFDIHMTSLSRVCLGRQKSAKGFTARYLT